MVDSKLLRLNFIFTIYLCSKKKKRKKETPHLRIMNYWDSCAPKRIAWRSKYSKLYKLTCSSIQIRPLHVHSKNYSCLVKSLNLTSVQRVLDLNQTQFSILRKVDNGEFLHNNSQNHEFQFHGHKMTPRSKLKNTLLHLPQSFYSLLKSKLTQIHS